MKRQLSAVLAALILLLSGCGSTADTTSEASAPADASPQVSEAVPASDTESQSASSGASFAGSEKTASSESASSKNVSSKETSSKATSSKAASSKNASSKAASSKSASSKAASSKADSSKKDSSKSAAENTSSAVQAAPEQTVQEQPQQQEQQQQEEQVIIIEEIPDEQETTVSYEITPPDDPDGTLNALLDAVNAERAKVGAPALRLDKTMCKAAFKHAEEEADVDPDHVRPDGSDCSTVYAEFGIAHMASAENLCAGYDDPIKAVEVWMNSDVHRNNMLNPSYGRMGVASVTKEGSKYGTTWAQIFAD